MLQAYKELLSFYNNSKPLRKGSLTSYSSEEVLAFTRGFENEEVFVIDNLRDHSVTYSIPQTLRNSLWLNAFDNASVSLGESIALENFEYIILKR